MDEMKRKERIEQMKRDAPYRMELSHKCSANNYARFCCVGDAWEAVSREPMGFYVYGEPLSPKVIATAQLFKIDPHDLDWHVEAVHGWEPHDEGYDERVLDAADCMVDAGYQETHDKEKCRFEGEVS